MSLVVKRQGLRESFDEKKTYGSVYAVCVSAHYSETQCKRVAGEVTKSIKNFVKNKKEVSSMAIRKKISNELRKKDKDLLFFYEQHIPNLKKL